MADPPEKTTTLQLVPGIDAVDAAEWDACAGKTNPFVSYAFLKALEDSGSVGARTGWAPHHVLLSGPDGRLAGCVPMYLKSHSYGEYVFDHGWAAAFQRAGGSYYPKLQVCVPFTPVPGPRLLVRPDLPYETTAATLLAGCLEVARQRQVSSLHVTFCTAEEAEFLGARGLLQRNGEQFHWRNPGYRSFEDFLSELASRKRKAVRKERREALESGCVIEVLSGQQLQPHHWDAMFGFYLDTGSRKWGTPYLNRSFFEQLGRTMAEQVVMILARRDGRYVAGALNLRGQDALYGRYWGCAEELRFLHFELCYYQAIDYAIAHGLARVEAGAQGPHKLARGYLPQLTYSAHWIAEAGFRRAVANFLQSERAEVVAEIDWLDERSPFRHVPD